MQRLLLLILLAVFLSAGASADKLQIAFCTPENTQCLLASDGKPDTCFAARHLQENFYFAVFNTIGQPATVEKLLLRTSAATSGRTNYTVSLASLSQARDLNCTPAGQTIECPAGLDNVTSMMIRPEPVQVRLRLLEVAASDVNGTRVDFTYCVAPEAPSCKEAMDGRAAADSPAVVSEPGQFPSWYGGLPGNAAISRVTIHRLVAGGKVATTFFRVRAAKDCELVEGPAKTPAGADGVEVLEFKCSGDATNLLRVWEISSDFLIGLCEIEVFGK